jgi:transcriptional regulator with XRE-family HTH domain
MEPFDLSGVLRRIRRVADLSQRGLADRCELSQSAVAQAESGRRDLPTQILARAAELAGLRLALLDAAGNEVGGMAPDTVRDLGGRRFPAHLDTVHSDERWWRWAHRFDRSRPTYTFGRDRGGRDARRRARGTPVDHHPFVPGDSPAERAADRRRAALRKRAEERERRFLTGELTGLDDGFTCSCPPGCDGLDDGSGRPVHADGCPCRCDVG